MRRSALAIILVALVASFGLASCSQGANGLPGQDASIVDIGNPDDDTLNPTSSYTNKAFGVTIDYPIGWAVAGGENDDHAKFSSPDGESVDATFVLTPLAKEEFIAANRIDPAIALTSAVQPSGESGFMEILTGVRRDGIGLILEQFAVLPIEGGNLIVIIDGRLAANSAWMAVADVSCDPSSIQKAIQAMKKAQEWFYENAENIDPQANFQDHIPENPHNLPGLP